MLFLFIYVFLVTILREITCISIFVGVFTLFMFLDWSIASYLQWREMPKSILPVAVSSTLLRIYHILEFLVYMSVVTT